MKKETTQLHTALQDVRLHTHEKTRMREALVTYMEYHPIRARGGEWKQKKRPSFSFSFFKKHHVLGASLIALLVTTSTFGVTSAASDALPGDLLYPVKININEEIKTVFMSRDERIAWERARAEMRLTEASQLAAEGMLDEKKQRKVASLFAQHAEAVVNEVRAVEENDPVLAAEMSYEFESSLDTHEAVLARLIVEDDNGSVDDTARTLVEQVHTTAKEMGEVRKSAEEQFSVSESDTTDSDTGEENSAQATSTEDYMRTLDDVAQDDERTKKLDSANMSERAAYRMQAKASEQLVQAMELLSNINEESDIAISAQEQIEIGKQMMEEGARALSEHKLNVAYRQYRAASAVFQKVNQLLQTIGIFSIHLYPEVFVTDTIATDTATTAQEKQIAQHGDENNMLTDIMRKELMANVRATQHTLLASSEDADVSEQVNNMIKDALAFIMRSDIALSLGDEEEALYLLEKADRQMQRAHTILPVVRDMNATSSTDDTASSLQQQDKASSTSQMDNDTVIVHRKSEEGREIFSGTLPTCTPITATELNVNEKHALTLLITATEDATQDGNVQCSGEDISQAFSVATTTDVTALPVSHVIVNGEYVPFAVQAFTE